MRYEKTKMGKAYWPSAVLFIAGVITFYIPGLPMYYGYVLMGVGMIVLTATTFYRLKKDRFENGWIALAFIDSYLQVGKTEATRSIHFDLTVAQSDGKIFRKALDQTVPLNDVDQLKVGALLPVKVNENDEIRLALPEEINQHEIDNILNTLSSKNDGLTQQQIESVDKAIADKTAVLKLSLLF